VTVSPFDDAHTELFYCVVQVCLESFDLRLVYRNTKRIIVLGANESLDRVELSGRGRSKEACLGGRLDLLKRAARSRKADEGFDAIEDAPEQPLYVALHPLQLFRTGLGYRVRDRCQQLSFFFLF
jgi:hypothetical protein